MMKRRKVVISILALALMVATPSIFVLSVRPVHAGGGVVLHSPFYGSFRVTAYFDHDKPNYGYGADGYNWIYDGERVPASYPNKTGEPYPYDGHDGWDWSMIEWTDVLAAAPGEVVVSEDDWGNGGYGNVIIIAHGNDYYTMYAHLRERLVDEGETVTAGQHIGESGDSGSPGSYHLHFGVRHGGYSSTAYSTDPFGWRGAGRDPLFDYSGEESSCLWAGVPGDDISCADIIVEDDGAGWEQYPSGDKNCWESGSWQRCDRGNGFRYHWTDVWSPANFWVSWQPWYGTYGQLRVPGYYQLHAFVPTAGESSGTKTAHAEYKVHHGYYNNETALIPVDQEALGDQWTPLGTYWLWPGQMGGYVSMDDYTGEVSGSRKIVADAMKFSAATTYLPDVRNTGGWTSSIAIRNEGDSSAQVAINYYNTSGGRVSDQTATVAVNGLQILTPPSGFGGPAIVVSSEDVSVVVLSHASEEGYGYAGVSNIPSVSGIGAGTELFVPCYMHNYYGWSSDLYAQNVGGASTTIEAFFYSPTGTLLEYQTALVHPNGRVTFPFFTGAAIGTVRLRATQPLAAVVRHQHAGMQMAYPAVTSGGTAAYVPSWMKAYYGWTSSYLLQEITGNSATVATTYYPGGSGPTLNLPARGQALVYAGNQSLPDGWIGAVKAHVTHGSGYMAGTVHHSSESQALGYLTYPAGSADLTLPLIRKNTGGWDASLTVQNLGTADAQVTLTFYNPSGTVVATRGPYTVHPGDGRLLYNELPTGTTSARVHSAGADVVAVVHLTNSAGYAMGYGAVP